MYKSIYVPVDNSKHAARAVDLALDLAKRADPPAKPVGTHGEAAQMHEWRFNPKQESLPETYLDDKVLA